MAIFNFTTSGGTFSLLINGSSRGTWDKVDEIDSEHSLQPGDLTFIFSFKNPYYSNSVSSSDVIQVNGTPLTGTLRAKVANLKDDVFYNAAGGGSTPYLVYTALLTQTGTDDPTAIVLENTIGSIVWSRIDVGDYRGDLVGAFPATKTWLMLNNNLGQQWDRRAQFYWDNANNVRTTTGSGNPFTLEDEWFYRTPVEIRVYL